MMKIAPLFKQYAVYIETLIPIVLVITTFLLWENLSTVPYKNENNQNNELEIKYLNIKIIHPEFKYSDASFKFGEFRVKSSYEKFYPN